MTAAIQKKILVVHPNAAWCADIARTLQSQAARAHGLEPLNIVTARSLTEGDLQSAYAAVVTLVDSHNADNCACVQELKKRGVPVVVLADTGSSLSRDYCRKNGFGWCDLTALSSLNMQLIDGVRSALRSTPVVAGSSHLRLVTSRP